MSAIINNNALWLAVAWPLLLTFPVLHTRLPWPRHLAIIPALLLLVFSGDVFLPLPWFLPGTGLAIETESRWLLAMAVLIWFMAASVTNSSKKDPAYVRTTPFFILTLAGNLGAILASDLLVFFSFTTLMGYGFYVLLIAGGGGITSEARHAGRLYLIYLIVADLLLFETLLLATSVTKNLQFEVIHQTMMSSSSATFYLWMAFIAFAFKIGIWPLHLWLTAAYQSAQQSTIILVGGVPVAMGLLGAARWIPPGEYRFYEVGLVMQIVGVTAILYAVLKLVKQLRLKLLPAWFSVAITGLFIAALGTGLAHPSLWQQYAYLTYPFIATTGVFLAVLTFAIARLQNTHQYSDFMLQPAGTLSLWTTQRIDLSQRWLKNKLLGLHSLWSVFCLQATKQFQRILERQTQRLFLDEWSGRITLFVLVGLALAWLAKS